MRFIKGREDQGLRDIKRESYELKEGSEKQKGEERLMKREASWRLWGERKKNRRLRGFSWKGGDGFEGEPRES